jgi:hypothetical protein
MEIDGREELMMMNVERERERERCEYGEVDDECIYMCWEALCRVDDVG